MTRGDAAVSQQRSSDPSTSPYVDRADGSYRLGKINGGGNASSARRRDHRRGSRLSRPAGSRVCTLASESWSGLDRRSSEQTAISTAPRWPVSSSQIPKRSPTWTALPTRRSSPKFATGSARASSPLVVLEAVKLVQSGLASDVDALWFVAADPETRLRRLMSRSGMDEASARARIAAAPSTVPEGVAVDAIDRQFG